MPSASLSSVNVELVSSPSSLLTPLCFKSPAPKSRTSPFLTPFGPLPRFPSCYRKISRRRSRQGIRRPGCPAARNESESGAMGSSFGMVPVPGRRKEVVSDDEERGGTGEPPGPQTELEMGRLPLSSSSPSLRNQPLLAKADIDRDVMEETYDSKQAHQKKKSWIKRIKVFGVEMSPDTFAVSIVYFVQGVLGLSRLAVNFYLKDDLHLDPAETAVISGFSSLPWLVKPLYGFISDSFPIFGYRRRSYLILSGLLGAFSWSMMATMVDSKYDAAICILLGSLSVAFSDVVVDSMVVERARGETQSTSGSLQSLCWGSSAFGGIVSSYFSGSLVDAYGVRFVFSLTAILPLMTSLVAVLVEEKSSSGRGSELSVIQSGFLENSKQNMVNLWDAIKQPNIFLPTLFIFLWQATPHSDSAMFFYTTNKLRFSPEFLGRVKLVTSIASLAGVAIYNGFLKKVPLRKIFLWTTILGSILGMTQVILVARWNQQFGISDQWFAIGDSLILTVLGQASFMPVLVLAARLCPQGMEATLFATLMSISNGGSVAGGLLGAWLTQILGVTKDTFDNLVLLIVVCNLSSLLPLPLLGLLPEQSPEETNIELESKSN